MDTGSILRLDKNEGATPAGDLLRAATDPELLRRYPDARPLERYLAGRLGVESERVLVTAGADDALNRICRVHLTRGRDIVLPSPTFQTFEELIRLAGAEIRRVAWDGEAYPTDDVLASVTGRSAAIAVVSPNNPTGATASRDDLTRLAEAGPLLIVDQTYAEFADQDLTKTALRLPNALVVRSLSKTWGLAGLRVGYVVGPRELVDRLRAAGQPYPVSGPSLAIARRWLEVGADRMATYIERIRRERQDLHEILAGLGASPYPSQANFVLARFPDACWVRDALAALGVIVRLFPRHLRIGCPGNPGDFARLEDALRTVLEPEALLLDLDGVLADVSDSYRRAIAETAASFGVRIAPSEIEAAKAAGNANNDWELTYRLIARRGISCSLAEVTRRFEQLYQGGLYRNERLLPSRDVLLRLASRARLGIVTGRPRRDAERFVRDFDVPVDVLVCVEDAAPKPDPAPVRLALDRLGVRRAWMVGDTPDDVEAARAAGVLPLAVNRVSGTPLVLNNLAELEERLS